LLHHFVFLSDKYYKVFIYNRFSHLYGRIPDTRYYYYSFVPVLDKHYIKLVIILVYSYGKKNNLL